MRQVLASVVVSALALAACGGGGGDEALEGKAAQEAVDQAMLSAEDLGQGWTQTGTSPAGESEGTDIDACLSDEVAKASNDPLAESDTHEFRKGEQPTQQQQLQISSAVLETTDLAKGLVDELASEDVRSCLTETFQKDIAKDAGANDGIDVKLGAFDSEEDFADAGDGATRITAPVELSAEGVTLPATVDLVVVHTGQVASAIVAFAVGDPVPDDDVSAWAKALADRQEG